MGNQGHRLDNVHQLRWSWANLDRATWSLWKDEIRHVLCKPRPVFQGEIEFSAIP